MLANQLSQPDIFKTQYNGQGVIFSLEVDNIDMEYLDIVQEIEPSEEFKANYTKE